MRNPTIRNVKCSVVPKDGVWSSDALTGIHFRTDHSISTDGTVLIKVPYNGKPMVDYEEEEFVNHKHVTIKKKSLLKLIKGIKGKRDPDLIIGFNDSGVTITCEGQTLLESDLEGYPDIDKVYPSGAIQYTICFGLNTLEKLIKALKHANNNNTIIEFKFRKPEQAVEFKMGDITGLIMPIRLK